nr:hypothetical protein [uncultured bacterium]
MQRLRQFSLTATLSLILAFVAALPPAVIPLGIGTGAIVATQESCGGQDNFEKLNNTLNQVAHSLEAAIDTNGKLYAAGTYGPAGSDGAIQIRQRVARAVHDSNEYLIDALTLAKGLTRQTFEGKKIEILQKLTLAASGLRVGNNTIDLVLQSVATLISQAVAIVQLFQSNDVRGIRFVIPKIDGHIKTLERLRELNSVPEVFAE